ncbi:MAG: hybrid sensor histidine kinase/response regulator [Chloroflexia bacterium]|nr:hybrid sensor histidine kinase/response regulator [Chloroflexia bacterium]
MRKRILVVEDDPILRAGMEQILVKQNYQVQTAGHGAEALERIPIFQPDLIISASAMPEMDGYDLYRQLRSTPQGKAIPFILMIEPEEKLPALPGLTRSDVISKPFKARPMLELVQNKLKQLTETRAVQTVSLSSLSPELLSPFFHEFRTSLTMVKTTIALLTNPSISYGVEEMREFLDIVRRGGDRVDRLVRDFLTILKLESKVAEREAREAEKVEDFEEIIKRVIDNLQIDIEEHEITVHSSIPKGLPALPILEEHLQTILEKLLHNAVKFSQRESKDVWVKAFLDKRGVRFAVIDKGIGIPKEEQDRIFDLFSQLSLSGLDRQGAGLGLAVAKGLVELYGGKIGVESEVDRGSAFVFFIPSQRKLPELAPEPEPEPSEEEGERITAEEAFRRLGITFEEDEKKEKPGGLFGRRK